MNVNADRCEDVINSDSYSIEYAYEDNHSGEYDDESSDDASIDDSSIKITNRVDQRTEIRVKT